MTKKMLTRIVLGFIFIIIILSISCERESHPKIKSAEFDFYLKYKFEGEEYVIEDVIVCEYTGYDISNPFGRYRTWHSYFKNDSRLETLVEEENVQSYLDPTRINTTSRLRINYGRAAYYMDDPNGSNNPHSIPHICYTEIYQTGLNESYWKNTPLTEEQAKEFFGLEIIELRVSDPIENRFGLFD
jgi:hypothetical protein